MLAHVRFSIAAQDAPDRKSLEQAIQSDPANQQLRFSLSALMLTNDEIEAALEQLMQMLRLDRFYQGELAHHGLLAIFNMLGNDHDLVRKYRPRMFDILGG